MSIKILLVEDNETNRDMLSRRLARAGFEIVLAASGPAALEMAQAIPNLILMDIGLGPEMNGWQAIESLKGDMLTSGIPIIVLTAHAMQSDLQRSRDLGCADFDTKPIDFPRLLEKIRKILGHSDAGTSSLKPFPKEWVAALSQKGQNGG